MTLRQMLMGGRFGHFAGAPPVPAAVAPAPAAKKPEEPEESEAAKAAAAEDEAAAKRAEDEEASKRARRKKTRRAKKREDGEINDEDDADGDESADDDDDDDDEDDMRKAAAAGHAIALDAAFRAGARSQRRRCAAIFSAKSAAANPVLALSLAFETSMTSAAAIAVLEKTPAPRENGLAARMAATGAAAVRIAPSAPESPQGAAAVSKSWDMVLAAFAPKK